VDCGGLRSCSSPPTLLEDLRLPLGAHEELVLALQRDDRPLVVVGPLVGELVDDAAGDRED